MDPGAPQSQVPFSGNGVAVQIKRDRAVAYLLAGCIVAICLIAGGSMVHPPSQWDLVNRAMDTLTQVILLLSGGLLSATIPTRKG